MAIASDLFQKQTLTFYQHLFKKKQDVCKIEPNIAALNMRYLFVWNNSLIFCLM